MEILNTQPRRTFLQRIVDFFRDMQNGILRFFTLENTVQMTSFKEYESQKWREQAGEALDNMLNCGTRLIPITCENCSHALFVTTHQTIKTIEE